MWPEGRRGCTGLQPRGCISEPQAGAGGQALSHTLHLRFQPWCLSHKPPPLHTARRQPGPGLEALYLPILRDHPASAGAWLPPSHSSCLSSWPSRFHFPSRI